MYINIYIAKIDDPPVGSAIFRMPNGRDRYEEVAGLAFAALSLRGLIAPEQASARFGAPVADAAGSLFYRVYLSRNLVIVITGAIFLLTRQWTPLAILLTVTAALPVFDMTVLSSNGVTPPVFHPLALALIAITAALAWRRVAAGKG
jgi:Domain of unknown function (DUF4267)